VPPPTVVSPDRTLIRRPGCPGEFAVPCSTSRAKASQELSPDGQDQPTPAKRHRGSSISGDPCRRPQPDLPWTSDPEQTVEIRSCQSRSEPPDLDPSIRIGGYPFALVFLLKSPWVYLKPTRSPAQFESNCRSAQFLAFRPLNSLEIEPAVQTW
jgi:hypothetical protein